MPGAYEEEVMPTYCFREVKTDKVVEVVLSWKEYERRKTREGLVKLPSGALACREYPSEVSKAKKSGTAGWPMLSDAAGCHPDQIPEFQAALKKRNAGADYERDGRVWLTDRAHRKKVCRAMELKDLNGGYGDP